MFNFFVENKNANGEFVIENKDFNHLKNVLRFKVGERFLVSHNGCSHLCELACYLEDCAYAKVLQENYNDTTLPISLYLFQGLIKGDKMDFVVQKAVELGADCIVPVEMARSIVKLDGKKKIERQKRLQAVCESAAKQSKRNAIPTVYEVLSFNSALDLAKSMDVFIIPYESHEGMTSTVNALQKIKAGDKVGILIGPEGGFEEKEVQKAIEQGGISISLGKRILRAETASLTALSMCMLYAESKL